MSTGLDLLKTTRFPVLDHGFVQLVDCMGSDQAIEDNARISYQTGTRKINETRGLLRYLMRHRHSTPFESAYLKFHIKLPIFVERQWARHRMHSWNEVSARYSELPEEYYVPETDAIRQQSKVNKQGREEPLDIADAMIFQRVAKEAAKCEFEIYHQRLNDGVARELARINLPLSTYTEKMWSGNLHNLLHFLSLRMDSHAQWEIRQYANIIGNEIVAKLFPLTWEAFAQYRLEAMQLSYLEIQVIQRGMHKCMEAHGNFGIEDFTNAANEIIENKREREECLAKLKTLGLLGD